MRQLTIVVSDQEHAALQAMAARDVRDLKEQARWVLLQEARRLGLLPIKPTPTADGNPAEVEERVLVG